VRPHDSNQPLRRPHGRVFAAARHLALRARVRAFHWRLDAELAAGFDPAGRPTLCVRAGQLLSLRHRRRLAAWLERLVEEADSARVSAFSAAVPIAHQGIREARASLLFLAHLLRHAEHVRPRGVAMVELLLRDGNSVVYVPSARGAVELRMQTALNCLVGERRADPEAWFTVPDSDTEALVGGS
jgi:hypothetical protein